MSEQLILDAAVAAVHRAAGAAGDASGSCDAAACAVQRGDIAQACQEMEWAEDNARAALARILEACAALAKAKGQP